MCGRYYLETRLPSEDTPEELEAWIAGATVPQSAVKDICPGEKAPALMRERQSMTTTVMRWGFQKPGGGLIINAKVETLRERPMFQGLVDRQRCAIPASGYYEWRDGDGQKFRIGFETGRLFCLAGLYRIGPGGGLEFVVVTQAPAAEIAPIHDRMPMMLGFGDEVGRWMEGELPLDLPARRLRVAAVGPEQMRMEIY